MFAGTERALALSRVTPTPSLPISPQQEWCQTESKYIKTLGHYNDQMKDSLNTSSTNAKVQTLQALIQQDPHKNPRSRYKKISKLLSELSVAYLKKSLQGKDKTFLETLLKARFESRVPNTLFAKWLEHGSIPKKHKVARWIQSLKGNFNYQTFLSHMNIPHLRTIRKISNRTIYRHACPTPILSLKITQIFKKFLSVIRGKRVYPETVDPQFTAYLRMLKNKGKTVVYNTLQTAHPTRFGLWREEKGRVLALKKAVEAEKHIFIASSLESLGAPGYLSPKFRGKKSYDDLRKNLLATLQANDIHKGFYISPSAPLSFNFEDEIRTLKDECYPNHTKFTTTEWNGFIQNLVAILRLKIVHASENDTHVFASCMDDIDRGGSQYGVETAWLEGVDQVSLHQINARVHMVKSRPIIPHWNEKMRSAIFQISFLSQDTRQSMLHKKT